MSNRVLVTGAAGFIGFHLSKRLLDQGNDVLGYDCLNDYYDVALKRARLEILNKYHNFKFVQAKLEDERVLDDTFASFCPDYVVNLAAQAGVRYSIQNPKEYIDANIVGFLNILEACRNHPVKHLLFASSSSVYGGNTKLPFSTSDNVDHPVSLYAATKKSNELMAHTYSHLYGIPSTGLRFFTVYGPWGRPDMALFLFTKAILNGEPIQVYNYGKMRRDFTYIDDIVEGIIRLLDHVPEGKAKWDSHVNNPSESFAPYKIYNIGNNNPVELERYIDVLEKELGHPAIKKYLPLQPGDVPETYADTSDLKNAVDFVPKTTVEEGIHQFVKWYQEYYKAKGSIK